MERFFPGPRVSGVLARLLGGLLVLLMIAAVLAAVLVAGVVTVVARTLALDVELALTIVAALAAFAVASAIVYGVYRVIPADPPVASSARLPAVLVGAAVTGLTLLYGLAAPWLVSEFEVYGIAASIFVTLIWLRLVFLALVYGAAIARYRDLVTAASNLGASEPDAVATAHVLTEEVRRAEQQAAGRRELEQRAAATPADPNAAASGRPSTGRD